MSQLKTYGGFIKLNFIKLFCVKMCVLVCHLDIQRLTRAVMAKLVNSMQNVQNYHEACDVLRAVQEKKFISFGLSDNESTANNF